MDHTCKTCTKAIQQTSEKALDGTFATVWSSTEDGWVCPKTGNEHIPQRAANEGTKVVHVVVNLEGGVGAADWALDADDLPSWDEHDVRWTLVVPEDATPEALTAAMDAFLGEYEEDEPLLQVRIGPTAWWVRLERDHLAPEMSIGPYPTEAAAVHAMEHALLIDGECQENALECSVTNEPDVTDEFVLIDLQDPDHTGYNLHSVAFGETEVPGA